MSFEDARYYKNNYFPPGIIMTEGQLWSEHRRFVLRHLRDFGFGKSSMEQLIKNEVYDLVAAMEVSCERYR